MTKIDQLVQVATLFRGTEVKPGAFLWNGRRYEVEHIYLVHKTRLGDVLIWHFTVGTSGGAVAKLLFDTASLHWQLESLE